MKATVADIQPGDIFIHPRVSRRGVNLLLCVSTTETTVDTAVGPLRLAVPARRVMYLCDASLCEDAWKSGMDVDIVTR